MRLNYFKKIAGLLSILIFLCAGMGEVAAEETTLPPKAQEAFTRGMAAAKQQEWELAIDYFEKARYEALYMAQVKAPQASQILFNLGLAYDKAPGAELVAIAWYQAYLAAAPDAQNASAVRTRIIELEVKVKALIKKLFKMAVAGVAEKPRDGPRISAYTQIAGIQEVVGERALARQNYETARTIVKNYTAPNDFKRNDFKKYHYLLIASSQIKAGDFEGVAYTRIAVEGDHFTGEWREGTLTDIQARVDAAIPDENLRDEAIALAEAGDFKGAKRKAMVFANILLQCETYIKMVRMQAESGDIEGAKKHDYSLHHWGCYYDITDITAQSVEDKTGGTQGLQDKEIKTWIDMAREISTYKLLDEEGRPSGIETRDIQGFLKSFDNVKDPEWYVQWAAVYIAAKAKSMSIDLWSLKKLASEIENAKT